ncbi:hypothetical protein COS44_01395 [bacterium (Candidatus Gribaldobacteria) CG03_land_8_20_14_0_80_36_40]|uniref:Uncharacterized protein n=1 Tax=bacterium (Candidatus Gribaldobacteria) CG03_land_8_20_14_0_80_36_40 TaxID=2014271 RepID=A0A2M7BZ37_9BACT|nr:MAG: hypothetical protein COS44_01395 [bacterium (Candidatus Gribaldobacteria) CG03_land_8_20_14_0_80_36_40]
MKKSELILRPIGSAGGRAKTKPPFRPPRLEPEAKRTVFPIFLPTFVVDEKSRILDFITKF